MKRMKIIYYVFLVLVLGTSSLGCKKSSDSPSGTKWTLNGVTHGVDAIVYYSFETYTAINPLTGNYIKGISNNPVLNTHINNLNI